MPRNAASSCPITLIGAIVEGVRLAKRFNGYLYAAYIFWITATSFNNGVLEWQFSRDEIRRVRNLPPPYYEQSCEINPTHSIACPVLY